MIDAGYDAAYEVELAELASGLRGESASEYEESSEESVRAMEVEEGGAASVSQQSGASSASGAFFSACESEGESL